MQSPPISILLVHTSFPSEEAARQFGTKCIQAQLAACIHIFPNVTSIYNWEKTVHTETECVVTAKTTATKFPDFQALLRAQHPYALPECTAMEVTSGSKEFLDWIRQS